jgi:hypothetical protein
MDESGSHTRLLRDRLHIGFAQPDPCHNRKRGVDQLVARFRLSRRLAYTVHAQTDWRGQGRVASMLRLC